MNPFDLLAVNMPMCDWLTFTSWRMDGFSSFMGSCWMGKAATPEKRMNYDGMRYGSMFIGDGVQNGHWHKMLQVSGAAADDVLPLVLDGEENWVCTQLDIQVTCEWQDADLFELLVELKKIHGDRKPSYIPSETGCTVYFGAWKSEKLVRVYHKSRKLVRFEVKYKRAYAEHMARTMINLPEEERRGYMKAWLRWELGRLNSKILYHHFNDALSVDPIKPVREVPREESDRERWIRKVVCPVLDKYTRSHDADRGLLEHIAKIVKWRAEDDNPI